MLAYKAPRVLEINPAFTSQTCAACGAVDPASRSARKFHCVACGHADHADVNAAAIYGVGDWRSCTGRGDRIWRPRRAVKWIEGRPRNASTQRYKSPILTPSIIQLQYLIAPIGAQPTRRTTAMEQLGLEALLERLGFNGTQRALAMATIIARMAAPGSERASWRWLCERSALGELLGVDFERMSMMRLYRASDALLAQRAAIEAHLFEQVADLFALPQTVTLYDLTNTFFEGEAAAQPKAERGHSKEKRSDCPLLTLGLVLDGAGFVRRSEVFAGAVNEDTTLAPMLDALHAPADALVVMDAGIATEANVVWLRENGYRYLVVSRERARRFDPDLAIALETRSRQTVHVHKVVDPDGGEVRLYCYSEARAKTEQGIAARFAARFEGELRKLHDGLKRPRTRKRLDHVWQRIGRIKEKSRGVGAHYVIDVIADDSGKKARAVTWERRPLAGTMITHPGVYCLRTNVEDWDEETLWRTYTALTDVEAVFRSLKSELGLRPIFHQTQKRSDGHLFITVIAYQLVQTIRRRLGEQGERASWASLRRILEGQQRVTATFRRKDGRTLHVRKPTRAELRQRAIYQALGADPVPGGIRKMIV